MKLPHNALFRARLVRQSGPLRSNESVIIRPTEGHLRCKSKVPSAGAVLSRLLGTMLDYALLGRACRTLRAHHLARSSLPAPPSIQ